MIPAAQARPGFDMPGGERRRRHLLHLRRYRQTDTPSESVGCLRVDPTRASRGEASGGSFPGSGEAARGRRAERDGGAGASGRVSVVLSRSVARHIGI